MESTDDRSAKQPQKHKGKGKGKKEDGEEEKPKSRKGSLVKRICMLLSSGSRLTGEH